MDTTWNVRKSRTLADQSTWVVSLETWKKAPKHIPAAWCRSIKFVKTSQFFCHKPTDRTSMVEVSSKSMACCQLVWSSWVYERSTYLDTISDPWKLTFFFIQQKPGNPWDKQIFIKIQFIWLIFVLRTEKNESRNRIDFHHIDLSWDWFLWWVGWLGAWPLTTPKDPGETGQNWSHHLEVWLKWAGGVFHSSCANCLRGNVCGRIFLRPICKD